MRSSVVVLFRVFVMLATLGGSLATAFFYNSPKRRSELFESIGRSRWLSNALVGERRGQAADHGIAHMRPGPANGQSTAEAPPWPGNSRLAATPPAASPKSLRNPVRSAVEPSRVPFAVRGAAAEPLAEEFDFRQVKSSSGNKSTGAVPQSGDPIPEVSDVRASPGDAAGLKRFTRIERRLRQLGATYYLLESWGTEGQLFRFHCRMAIGGWPHRNRYFEATDKDPLEAMEQVLQEVQLWRFGHSK